jgi:hypothetical protein
MSDTSGKKPTLIAYTVRGYKDGEKNEKSQWLRIGAAWTHKDREGFDVTLEAFPVDGRIVLRKNAPKAKGDDSAGE